MTKSLLSITALQKKNSTSSSTMTSNTVWVMSYVKIVFQSPKLETLSLECPKRLNHKNLMNGE